MERSEAGMNDERRMEALPPFLFGGENFSRTSRTELKRALLVDGIAVSLLLLGLAGAVFGQSQDPPKDQKQPEQQGSSPAVTGQPAPGSDTAKTKAKKVEKVYSG